MIKRVSMLQGLFLAIAAFYLFRRRRLFFEFAAAFFSFGWILRYFRRNHER